MVSQVFHPHFLEVSKEPSRAPTPSIDGVVDVAAAQDALRIPLPPVNTATDGTPSSKPARSPYLLTVVVAYLRSLLSMQILPHKILQCFVFDLYMYFQQEHTLQQLLHYHVLLDSPELVLRLKEVASVRGRPWATQACLDMALRTHEFSVVADILLHTKQYLDLVPFLSSQRDISFKVSRLLEQIDADIEAKSEDPDLLEHIISELKTWEKDAALDSHTMSSPDFDQCEKWMS